MKTIKLFTILLLSLLATQSSAVNDYLPDTLWYDNGNEIYVRFSLHTIGEIESLANSNSIISPAILDVLDKDDLKSSQSLSITIDETNADGVLFVDKETETIIILPEQLNKGTDTSFQLLKLKKTDGTVIDFFFKDLVEFLSFIQDDWNTKISELVKKVENSDVTQIRQMMTLYTKDSASVIVVDPPVFTPGSNNLDQLILTAGVGLNTFKKEFLPDFNFRLALAFSKKGYLKNKYFMDYQIMYDFLDEDGKSVPKSGAFLSLGYMRNFSDSPDEVDWYGISVGYLLRKKSPIFDDDTWKISVYRKIGKNKEVGGHLYFPNNFGKVFPGISVKIDL